MMVNITPAHDRSLGRRGGAKARALLDVGCRAPPRLLVQILKREVMVTMLVGTFVPHCQDREGGTGHNWRGGGVEQGDFKWREKTPVCLLYLWRLLSGWVRKTEQSLKFVVCGDASAVNRCVLPTHAPPRPPLAPVVFSYGNARHTLKTGF